ncbi:uncharacterized protein LOC135135940 [Zophobas morio]|uniref:uncharacterized protein LOC135135940 n=1 Tax=Zophobas morio TaxID=2755281 RepID=UPI00308379F6
MPNSFVKRPGTTDLGKEYEELNVANIIFKAVTHEDIKDFTLSTDDSEFGSFDDIVFEAVGKEINQKYAIQLKHANNDHKALNPISLAQDTGNFAIVKYFQSYKKICELGHRHKLILFTNRKFNNRDGTKISFEKQRFTTRLSKMPVVDEFVNSSRAAGTCYKFTNVQSTVSVPLSKEQQEYKDFFQNFCLYTNQANAFQMKQSLSARFQEAFSCSDSAFDRYLQFISNWTKLQGKKAKLNKSQMKRVITFCVLSHLIKPLCFKPVNEKVKMLQDAISEFDVTIFEKESEPLVCQIWGDKKCELENKLKDINDMRTAYHLELNHIKDLGDLSDKSCSQLLWLLNICPLIVSASASTYEIIQLCHQEKFVLLGNHIEDQISGRLVFQNLSDLFFKSEIHYQNITTAFEYSLQEKEELPLQSLTEKNEDFRKVIVTDDLVQMLENTFFVGGKQESFDFPYINRFLTVNIIDFEYLKKIDKDTIVVIDCLPKDYQTYEWLRNFNLIEVEGSLQKRPHSTIVTKIDRNVEMTNSAFKPDLHVTEGVCTKETFKTICKANSVTKRHHLRLNCDGKLQWIRSLSDVDELEPFRTEGDCVKENELCFIENKINLIVGEPGMGKSVLMRSLKNKFSANYLTIIFYTEDISAYLDFKNKYSTTSYMLEEYILHEKFKNMKKFEKKILLMLMRRNNVIYIWDGLDELSAPNIQVITDIILYLYKKNVCQWLTCRLHLKNYLEHKFNVFSKTIIQFSEEQQSAYIEERMKNANHTEESIKNTIQKIKKLIIHHEILGIPLQIFMLTELFLKNPDKYSNCSEDIFNIIDLYQYFLDEKFDIYYKKLYFKDYPQQIHYREEHKQDHKNARIKKYQKAALKTLVPSIQKETNECKEFLEKIKQEHDPVGIITEVTVETIPYFIHKSFAEYFVATYFVKKYESNNSADTFRDVLFESTNRNIRFFFDLLLAKNSPAHVAVLYKNINVLKSYNDELKDLRDLGERSVLHIACSWGQEYPAFQVHNNNEIYTIDISNHDSYSVVEEDPKYADMLRYLLNICSPSEKDDLFKYTSLTYAETTKSLFAKTLILQKHNLKFSKFCDDLSMASVLYYSVKFGYMEVIDLYKVFPYIKTSDGSTYLHLAVCHPPLFLKLLKMTSYRKTVNCPDANLQTPLSRACCEGQSEAVKFLTSCSADINSTCCDGRTPLHYACQFGYEDIVLWLIKTGADFNVKDKKHWTPLHWACYNGHIRVVDILLAKEAVADLPNDRGWTPLHLACINGHHEIVELLLSWDGIPADSVNVHRHVNSPKDLDLTPLHSACWYGHESTVEVLLRNQADLNRKMRNGRTALHYACEKGQFRIVQLLCQYSPMINIAADEGWTPLHFATNHGSYAVVKLLINIGAHVNVPDVEGWTPLHLASYKGHVKIVRLLLKKGANREAQANDGQRAIHFASQTGNDRTVKVLLKHGCQINATDNKGLTPFHLSCLRNQESVVLILSQNGADVNAVTNQHKTAFHLACQLGNYETVKVLLQLKADFNIGDNKNIKPIHVACYNGHAKIVRMITSENNINATNIDGWTPLHYACHGGHVKTATILISLGASVNSKTKTDGWTALHIACLDGHDKIVRLLLDSRTDINALSNTGRTPLHVACENNHHNIAWLLLFSGADIDSYDAAKCTPLHLACEKGHTDIIELLVSRKADINASNDVGWTCLHLTSMNGNADVCRTLLKLSKHIDVNAVDHETKTSFYWACQYGHEAICDLLVKNEANISIKAEDGKTALHVACQYGREKIVRLLLAWLKDIDIQDVNVEDFDGCTPLHPACAFGDHRIVELLIKSRADVNTKDIRNKTPLHTACENGHDIVATLLLKAGAKIAVYTTNNETPLHLAVQNGHQNVISLLKSHSKKNACCRIT